MPNSTIKLQAVVDYAQTIPELSPVRRAGGFSLQPALEIANDVMAALLAEPFNWKWNRVIVPPFVTNSWQQDYVSQAISNIGWVEHGVLVDINNSTVPKPIFWLRVVRDLERTSYAFGTPDRVCWLPNDQLMESFINTWPGAGKVFTNPLGQVSCPANPIVNILDANNNILTLTTYGTTGLAVPLLAANSPAGTTVADGTCVWTVCDPKAQGFRLSPLPTQTGVVYQVHLAAQAKALRFASLQQTLEPVPDDYSHYFREGFIAICHRHSDDPRQKALSEVKKAGWLATIAAARKQGDREPDDAGFVPVSGIMQGQTPAPLGPAWPFGPFGFR